MGVRVEVEIENRFGNLADRVPAAATHGTNLAAEHLLELSLHGVPFDQGTLAGTGAVERATGPDQPAAVSYDTPYAVRLHEHPEYNFSTKANPNAQGKWLENAALENRAELGGIVGAAIRDA